MNKIAEIERLESLLNNPNAPKTEIITAIIDTAKSFRVSFKIKDLKKILAKESYNIVYEDLMEDIMRVIESSELGEYTDEENEEFKQERLDGDEFELMMENSKISVREEAISDRIPGREITVVELEKIDYDQFINNMPDILQEKLVDEKGNMYTNEHEFWNLVDNFKFSNEAEKRFKDAITNGNIEKIVEIFAKEEMVIASGLEATENIRSLEETNKSKDDRNLEEI